MAFLMKRVTKHLPNGHVRSYYQKLSGFGDATVASGPITSPDQNPTTGEIQMPDDYVGSTPAPSTTTTPFDPTTDTTVATVGPIITGSSSSSPSTSGITTSITDTANTAAGWITGTKPAPGAPMSQLAMLLVAGTVVGAYYVYEKMKKSPAPRRASTRRR
jgi:hypothetical protein